MFCAKSAEVLEGEGDVKRTGAEKCKKTQEKCRRVCKRKGRNLNTEITEGGATEGTETGDSVESMGNVSTKMTFC